MFGLIPTVRTRDELQAQHARNDLLGPTPEVGVMQELYGDIYQLRVMSRGAKRSVYTGSFVSSTHAGATCDMLERYSKMPEKVRAHDAKDGWNKKTHC